MAKDKKLLIVGGMAVLFLLVAYYAWGSDVVKPDIGFNGKTMQCTANIDSDYFSGADINKASCINTGKSCIVGLSTMAVFGVDGRLRLDIGGVTYATSGMIETSNLGSINAVIKACVPQEAQTGTILFVNDAGGIEDTREVSLL